MKKRTDEEKRQMIEEACDLFNDAAKKITQGKQLLHLCGIELCDSFTAEKIASWHPGCNIQIFRGIGKMEKILSVVGYYKKRFVTEKEDKSRKYIDYKDLVFMQVGDERTSTQAKFTFR